MTPLFPWRPATLSPTDRLRFVATYTLVAAANLFLLLLEHVLDDLDLPLGAVFEIAQFVLEARVVGRDLQADHRLVGHLLQDFLREHRALALQTLAAVFVEEIRAQLLPLQRHDHALLHFVVKNADLVLHVLLHHVELFLLDRLRAVILFDALAGEDFHADDDALDARRADERRVANVARLLAEDRAEQFLFRRQLRLALRRDLADEDVARLDVRADADDAAVVEVLEESLRHIRDVARDFFRTQFRVARLDFELLDVDRRVVVVLHHLLGHEDRVFEVVAAPWHERDEHVAPERELAELRARSVAQHLTLVHLLPDPHDGLLVDARVLVAALELRHVVDVSAHLLALVHLALDADDDALAVDEVHRARPARHDDGARIASRDVFHACADEGRPRPQQRHSLALHVRSHQRAVRIVIFQERNQRCGDRDELFRRDVDELHLVARRQDEVAGLARVDAFLRQVAVGVDRRVRLGDDVLVLFPRGQVEGVRLDLDALLLRPALLVHHLVGFDDVAGFVLAAGGVDDDDVVGDASVFHLAVRRLDEAELVDARVARQRRDQSDVRTFRRLNRADAPVVRRVDVAHFESGALTRQTARPERRETPLVRDLGERVRLVHELAELRRPEELANRGHDRLRVDQVVRHRP